MAIFLGNDAPFSAGPKRSSLAPLDHLSLYPAFETCFNMSTDSLQWPAAQQPKIVESYPEQREGKFDTQFDVILMSIAGSQISSTSNSVDRRPKGIMITGAEPYPGLDGYLQVHSHWQEDVKVRFDILSKANRKANELAAWWHRTLLFYAHYMKFFMARGVNDFRFVERLADQTNKEYGQTLYCRPLIYQLRLELDILTKVKTLDRINLHQDGSVSTLSSDG